MYGSIVFTNPIKFFILDHAQKMLASNKQKIASASRIDIILMFACMRTVFCPRSLIPTII
jgi:hypothetical protein